MFFDGSITPKRVVSLSGASGLSRNAGISRQRFEFRSVLLERERSSRKILQFFRYVAELKRNVLPLYNILPSLIASAERYVDELTTSLDLASAVNPETTLISLNKALLDNGDVASSFTSVVSPLSSLSVEESAKENDGISINTSPDGPRRFPGDCNTWSMTSSDIVSLHPVCRLMRVVIALTRYDWNKDYSEYALKCLSLFRRWCTSSHNDNSMELITSTPLLKVQFIILCSRFLRIWLLPLEYSILTPVDHGKLSAPAGPIDPSMPQQLLGEISHGPSSHYGFGLMSSSSWLPASHLPSMHSSTTLSDSVYLKMISANRERLSQERGAYPSSTEDAHSDAVIEGIILSQCTTHLHVTSTLLSECECDKAYYVAKLFGLLSPDQRRKFCADYAIMEKWYPEMFGRVLANSRVNSEVFGYLLDMGTLLMELCDSKAAAIQLFVNSWVVPKLEDNLYDESDLIKAARMTMSHKFLYGLCCVGCKPLAKSSSEPRVGEESDSDKSQPQKIRNITQQLERTLKTHVPTAAVSTSPKWMGVSDALQMQVKAILNAVDFLPFTRAITWYTGEDGSSLSANTVESDDIGSAEALENLSTVDVASVFHNRDMPKAGVDSARGPFTRGFAHERLFSNMFHLIWCVNSSMETATTRDTIASALSVMLLCVQFVKASERKTFCGDCHAYRDLLGRILYAYRADAYIVLMIVMLLVPLSQWDYFTTDMDSLVITNSKCALEELDSFEEDSSVPEIDGHIANLLVSCQVPSTLTNQLMQHYTTCCGSNFSHFISNVSADHSNNSTFSYLWIVLSLLVNYCLKIMHDAEIIGYHEQLGVFDIDGAVFLANALNRFYWHEIHPLCPSKDRFNYKAGEHFPGNLVCSCGIEARINPLFHVFKDSPFDPAYWGTLARKFNERFFRIPDPKKRSRIVFDVERAVLSHLKNKNLDASILSVVENIPQTVSFETRLQLFVQRVSHDKSMYRSEYNEFFDFVLNVIRRTHIVEDGLATLGYLSGFQLKQPFKVIFVDETGVREDGIDGGGLFKEFLISLCSIIFDPAYGIFEESPYDRSFSPSPNSSLIHEEHLTLFNFVGKVIGKALYEHILIEPVLSPILLNLMLKIRNTLDDFKSFDPVLYRNITSMRDMTAEEVESLGLTFTIAMSSLDNSVQVDIVEGGSRIKVTKDNLESFIYNFADFKCNRAIEAQSSAFLQGLSSIIPLNWLKIFSPEELVVLISGSADEIDIDDMKANTVYSGGYTHDSPIVLWFWEIMSSFDNEMRRAFLWFVTCCKRAPLLGFKQLQPLFCITRDSDTGNMPTVSTCTNLLKLPEYRNKSELRAKLVAAMTMCKGFGIV